MTDEPRAPPASSRPLSRPASREPGQESLSVVPVCPGRLQDYDVQKPVGKGGYAIVYKGVRKDDGRIVAIKKVEIFEMAQKKRERCLQEVALLQQLDHPNIIQMVDAFIDENMLIIVFEWAPAGDLKRLIKKTAEAGKALDEASIWNFFYQIADGLRYMHAMRIMHRDIKPANVLVGANGALKLGDLGLGRQLSEQTMEAFSKVGTPYYVSPEVVKGAGYDWKSDVWSMGCLLYELACLRSPFEMEGANLYDVFQKISKGDFAPLPADQFSETLRHLVLRMLQIDPSKRPELEEVWAITKAIVEAQAAARQDVHAASEQLYSGLVALEAEVLARLTSGPPANGSAAVSQTPPNGKRRSSSTNSAAAQLAPPPCAALRRAHPLYFAGPVPPASVAAAEEAQKRQLAVVMQIFAWLLRLNDKHDAAAAIEAQLDQVPVVMVHTPRAPSASQPTTPSGRSPSRSPSRSSSRGRAAAAAAALAAAAAAPPQQPQPQGPQLVPVCVNLLKGADAVKRGAHAVGLSTEFAPVAAVAAGYGRAVCGLLTDLLQVTLKRVPLGGRPLQRQPEAPADDNEEEVGEEALQGAEEDLIMAHALRQQDDGGDSGAEEEAEFDFRSVQDRAHASAQHSAASSSHQADAAPSGAAASSSQGRRQQLDQRTHQQRHQAVGTSVDPAAWRAEAERLAPQLSRIRINARDAYGDWSHRWTKLKEALQELHQQAPAAAASLGQVGVATASQLDRIGTTEARLNNQAEAALGEYRASRQRLAELQRDRDQLEELTVVGHAALTQLTERIAQAAARSQDRANELDGSLQIKGIQDAIRGLKKEIRGMDRRLGVVDRTLLSHQCKHMQRTHMHMADDSSEGGSDHRGAALGNGVARRGPGASYLPGLGLGPG